MHMNLTRVGIHESHPSRLSRLIFLLRTIKHLYGPLLKINRNLNLFYDNHDILNMFSSLSLSIKHLDSSNEQQTALKLIRRQLGL